MRSQRLELVNEAVAIVDGINQIPGMPDNWLPASEQAYADIFLGLSVNLSPEEAAREANKRTDPVNRGRIEAIQSEIKATVKKKPDFYLDTVVGHFDGATSIDLGVLENEYQDLYVNYREGGYDDPAAEKKALEVLDRNWSLSEAGGDRMMRHAPEQFFKTVSPQAIREDFVKQVQFASEATGLFQVNDDTLYELFSDQKTNTGARQGNPTYRMRVITDGVVFVLTGFRYVVPVKELENNERIKNKQINDEVIEAAKRTLLIKQKVQRGRF